MTYSNNQAKTDKQLHDDKETLKYCLELHKEQITIPTLSISSAIDKRQITVSAKWWESEHNVITVARILVRYGQIENPFEVINFFEAPYKYEDKMRFIVENM